MIELIPAIDIIGGKCVRLSRGNYDTKKEYGDPTEMAQRLEAAGFRRLHVVDLDGAKSRHVVNDHVLRSITRATRLEVDFGGGIKSDADLDKAFEAGARMVTIGSVAISRPDKLEEWLKGYGAERIILGADARNGRISINGWKEDSDVALMDFIGRYRQMGVKKVLCTDISRDGMLSGPATELYKQVMETYHDLWLIASGGVSSLQDIEALDREGVPAVVFGKAIYEGRIDIDQLTRWKEEREG